MGWFRLHGGHCWYQRVLGCRWGKQHCIWVLVLYEQETAIQPLATPVVHVGRKSNMEVVILYMFVV